MALPTKLTLEIVTPDRALAHGEVDEVQLPGAEGYLGVLPGHTPLLVSLRVGEMWYRQGTEIHYLFVAFGFAEVLPDRVIVLAQTAEKAEEIDIERAEVARQQAAEAEKAGPTVVDMDFERARISMMKSLIRLQVAERARMRK
jgi:F-type H+-transporting ATPase subunit epsilon